MKRAVVLYSGGLDSVTALYWTIKNGYDPIALSFMEHGRQKSEIKAARKIINILNVKLIEIPLEFIKQKDDLENMGINLFQSSNLPSVYIPQKNLIFYSIAAHFAEIYQANAIIVGLLSFDFNIFPDNSMNFFDELQELVNIGLSDPSNRLKIKFPFKNMDKSQVIQLALDLNVPLKLTWSCYEEADENGYPCGICKACVERKLGFERLNRIDPLFKK